MRFINKIPPKISKAIGLCIAIIPLIWIFCKIDLKELLIAFTKVAWWTAPSLFGLVVIGMFLQGVRWWMLLHTFIPTLKFRTAIAYHFIGAFYSIVLPSSASQDIIKTLLVSKKHDYSIGWASIWLARILGLLVLASLSLYGFITIDKVPLPPSWKPSLYIVYLLFVVLLIGSFSKKVTRPFRILLSKFLPKKLMIVLEKIRESIYWYRDKKSTVLSCLAVTFFTQLTLILNTVFAIKGITGHLYISECLAFIPIIELISLSVPFTPNGMGVRETLSVLFFKYLGLSNEQLGIYILFVFIFSIVPRVVGIIPVIHGMFLSRNLKIQV